MVPVAGEKIRAARPLARKGRFGRLATKKAVLRRTNSRGRTHSAERV